MPRVVVGAAFHTQWLIVAVTVDCRMRKMHSLHMHAAYREFRRRWSPAGAPGLAQGLLGEAYLQVKRRAEVCLQVRLRAEACLQVRLRAERAWRWKQKRHYQNQHPLKALPRKEWRCCCHCLHSPCCCFSPAACLKLLGTRRVPYAAE